MDRLPDPSCHRCRTSRASLWLVIWDGNLLPRFLEKCHSTTTVSEIDEQPDPRFCLFWSFRQKVLASLCQNLSNRKFFMA
ncbi:hypothetical protein GDO81_018434 [Engystomops pustulosus]|uniref:Uncharacterized protein n=1 Tax=Engystomops pustulosus TaxID=76066 RepID=A0AAV6ZP66_ENGPU|nr:hypothetical protein GDO81_018434 [Engystomops pustulosus]